MRWDGSVKVVAVVALWLASSGCADGEFDEAMTEGAPGSSTGLDDTTNVATSSTSPSTGGGMTEGTTALRTTGSTTTTETNSSGPSTGTTGSSSSETGPPLDCTTASFDTVPGAPLWSPFNGGGGSVTVAAGKLVLDVTPAGASGVLAALRTAETGNYEISRVTATLDSVPGSSVVTTSLTLGTSDSSRSYAVVIRDGTVRVELSEDRESTVLGSANADELGWPMRIEVQTEGDQVTTTIDGATESEVIAQSDMPVWFDDIRASLSASTPMPFDPMGTVVADHFEICPPL